MKPRMVWISYSREFPHPIADCYRWLTDYQDHDPSLAGDILREREVIERHPDRVVMQVRNEALGRAMKGRAEVRLYPDEWRYEARPLSGDGGGLLYTYQLTALGPSRTRLDVRYGHRARRWGRLVQLHVVRPFAKRAIDRMWAGFADAMAKDLAPAR